MTPDPNRPEYLRPVPTHGAAAEAPAAAGRPAEQTGPPGLTPPLTRSHSGQFITDVIVDLGYLSDERVQQVIAEARTAGRAPEVLMLDQGLIDGDQLSRAIAERYGLDHVDLNSFNVDMGAANLVGLQTARRYRAVPVGYLDSETVILAMADPANVLAIDDIQMMTGLNCRVAVAAQVDIDALVSRLSTLETSVAEAVMDDADEDEPGVAEVTDMRESADDAPVIKLVYSVLGQAVSDGASDIHFEPEEKDMRVRFRVDGVLHEAARVPKRMVSGVISRIKIMSDLDIAEKRVPQDGRVSLNVDEHKVDLRVVTVPTQKGEGCTIRVLDKSQALRSLDDLGMQGEQRERFEGAFRQAYGAVLVTGPTGSGKSTTLYSALTELNHVSKNIITIEDPVEYRLEGVNQIGVNRKAGLTFANGLRSMLRADPDIMMVGEIRDAETARIAIEAALTGHMVLSTLHTNDAPGAISRLAKMGIESFLTASAVDCVVAQRLARVLCTHCKRRVLLERSVLEQAGFRVGADVEAYEPVGCARCKTHRLQGSPGPLLGDGDERAAQGPDDLRRPAGGDRRRRARGGHAHPARRRPAQGPRRDHQHRRGRPRRGLRRWGSVTPRRRRYVRSRPYNPGDGQLPRIRRRRGCGAAGRRQQAAAAGIGPRADRAGRSCAWSSPSCSAPWRSTSSTWSARRSSGSPSRPSSPSPVSAPVNRLSTRMPRGLAILIVYSGLIGVPIVIGAILIPPAVSAISSLVGQLPSYVQDVTTVRPGQRPAAEAQRQLRPDHQAAGAGAEPRLRPRQRRRRTRQRRRRTARLAVQRLHDPDPQHLHGLPRAKWTDGLIRYRPQEEREAIRRGLDRMAIAVASYVGGALAQATIAGIAAFIVLSILGVDAPLALAVIIALLDLIPLIGATIGAFIVALITLFTDFPTATIIWVVFAIAYQQFENYVIQPRIQARAVALDPFIIVVAALFGGFLLGVVGALLAIPTAAAIQIGVREFLAYRRTFRGAGALPAETAGESPT